MSSTVSEFFSYCRSALKILPSVNGSRSEQNPMWLWLFISPEGLALHSSLSSKASLLWLAEQWLSPLFHRALRTQHLANVFCFFHRNCCNTLNSTPLLPAPLHIQCIASLIVLSIGTRHTFWCAEVFNMKTSSKYWTGMKSYQFPFSIYLLPYCYIFLCCFGNRR